MTPADSQRTIGLLGATGIGVGAIVGGGILALAGAAFAATGPSAVLAFGLNGLIALLTAASFAEVSSKFPQSGGAYTFAKRVVSIEAAFGVGWIVWFASIVAAVLYAYGFGQFAVIALAELWPLASPAGTPAWLTGRTGVGLCAALAVGGYTLMLLRRSAGGGPWANIGKLVVFGVLIGAGFWALRTRSAAQVAGALQPFLARGTSGLFQAMGFTFIALQGFDLIAAGAGQIRQPEKTIPRAMFLSLGIALLVYLPLLFVLATAGTAVGTSITTLAGDDPERLVALAVEQYLGRAGYWLVVVAALLSMLSALKANLFAATHVAAAMAADRALPNRVAQLSVHGTPSIAVLITALIVTVILLVLPSMAAAGAASSLIFLISFALVHGIAILLRRRSGNQPPPFRAPLFPLVPVCGGTACVALAIYQGVVVPSAGLITVGWLLLGGGLFLGLFAARARVLDETVAARDPEIHRLRGRTPLVLVPMANPDHSRNLISVAGSLTPPGVGSVLMLSVVVTPDDWDPDQHPQPLEQVQQVLRAGIAAAANSRVHAEALATLASEPWHEIGRVAKAHDCETILFGLRDGDASADAKKMLSPALEELLNRVDSDVVLLRAPADWSLLDVRRIVIPTRGRGANDPLLARLIASLARTGDHEAVFLQVVPSRAGRWTGLVSLNRLKRIAADIAPNASRPELVRSDSPLEAVVEAAQDADLVVLGIQRLGRTKSFGPFTMAVAARVRCPLMIISRRG